MASQKQINTQVAIAESPFTPYGDPNVTFSVPLAATRNNDNSSPAAKRVLEENRPLPSTALLPEANSQYPLLTTDSPPFPYIDPTFLTSPTWEAAQLSTSRRVPGKLPVVTPNNLSVGLHKALKKKPGPRPPIYHAPTVQFNAPPPQTVSLAGSAGPAVSTTAGFGNMGPPSHASLKRKWKD